ncbi:hypothetical protein CKA32_000708 [Geitlerinema sp. FC II]|nr:hypothetical protein CKA32_000708 [Geitlerinema sp. FC II]
MEIACWGWLSVSIPRRDFWVFQPVVQTPTRAASAFQSLEGIFGFFNGASPGSGAVRTGFNP